MTDELLTPDDLRDIEARAEAATPGRWYTTPKLTEGVYIYATDDGCFDRHVGIIGGSHGLHLTDKSVENAELIAHARADVPRLLAHIRAQDAELARLRDALGAVVDAEAHGIPGGYIGTDERIKALESALTEILSSPLVKNPWDGSCAICGEWHGYDHEKDAECVLGRAKRALDLSDDD